MIGRKHELETIARHVDAGGAVRLDGEAGIGKTTVWRAAVDHARERGLRVLAARPVEPEQHLSYAAVTDLIEPVADEVLPLIPDPQRRALERIMLIAASDEPLDARLVGAAVRSALTAFDGPVLVAIDDVQWLDAASAAALGFALRRRLSPAVLLAGRTGCELPLNVPAEVLLVGPLTVGAIHHLIVERLGTVLRRAPLLRLHELSGGNPFYALELARANPEGREIVVPPSLQGLLLDRLRALPAETQKSLAALALGGDGRVLAPAYAAGIVEEADGASRFVHPLYAEASVALLSEGERRTLHAQLAEGASDPERRARHLASAARGPDERVAASLEETAQAATHRGAFVAAAELWELAAELTPAADEAKPRRATEAGIAHVLAGNPEAGGALLGSNLERLPAGPLRQRGLVHLALRIARDDARAVVPVLERALSEADEPQLRYESALLLAYYSALIDDVARSTDIAREHLRFAEAQGDHAVLEDALLLAAAHRLADDRPAWDLLGRAREIATERDGDRARRAWGWAPLTAAYLREGRIGEARAALEEARSEALLGGSASYDTGLLLNLSILELAAGDARAAHELADDALAIAEQMDDPSLISMALVCALGANAVLGDVEGARGQAGRALELARRIRAVTPENGVFLSLGLLELSLGRADAAAADYRRLTPLGLSRLSCLAGGRGALDAVEAFAETGDVGRAGEIAAGLPDDAHEKAYADACVAAAQGDVDRAIELVQSAPCSPAPFRSAREQLLFGRLLRRARRKREARSALEAAQRGFLGIEAPLWAERAAEELSRLGGRRPAGTTLTPSEHRVATLVASGLSNKQVAAQLVVTVRTVESHLSRVYAKLGVDSRAALAARWTTDEHAKTVDLRNTG